MLRCRWPPVPIVLSQFHATEAVKKPRGLRTSRGLKPYLKQLSDCELQKILAYVITEETSSLLPASAKENLLAIEATDRRSKHNHHESRGPRRSNSSGSRWRPSM